MLRETAITGNEREYRSVPIAHDHGNTDDDRRAYPSPMVMNLIGVVHR